jgi:hypothetical protein
MFHQEDSVGLCYLVNELDHLQRFLNTKAGQRLIKEQQFGPGGQRHGNLQLALLAMAQRERRSIGAICQTHVFKRELGFRDYLLVGSCIAQPVPRVRIARLRCQAAVFQRAEFGKNVNLLITSGEP